MAERAAAGLKMVEKGEFRLQPELLLRIHERMLQARVLEERLIRMFKQSEGYFWLGGPGEEAFNVPLGLLIKKGQGINFDFLHLHYRSIAILLAMGPEVMQPIDAIRQMKNTATDPFSGGRNFCGHPSRRAFNVVPVTSTIETQYVTCIGTALAQKRHGGDSITIVTGGDAGTAEGDFASSLIWATRPGAELPLLIVVTDNGWGISTTASSQHGEKKIADRGKSFGMRTMSINGNDVEESYFALREAITYVRQERRPFLLEARVSRLYGHSSATGANFIADEEDPLALFEAKLENNGILSREQMTQQRADSENSILEAFKKAKQEPMPNPKSIYDHIFCEDGAKRGES